MRDLLTEYFAVDKSIITDELVRIRYEASAETFEAYRAMFFDPRHAGNELGITEEQVRSIRTPSLLVHGREDKVVPPEVAWNMVRLLPTADTGRRSNERRSSTSSSRPSSGSGREGRGPRSRRARDLPSSLVVAGRRLSRTLQLRAGDGLTTGPGSDRASTPRSS